jgi:uncharacterized membrane protein AbrB (regulator of aidB expression)
MFGLVVSVCNLLIIVFAVVVLALLTHNGTNGKDNSISNVYNINVVLLIFALISVLVKNVLKKFLKLNSEVLVMLNLILGVVLVVVGVVGIILTNEMLNDVKHLNGNNVEYVVVGLSFGGSALGLVCGVGVIGELLRTSNFKLN